MQLIRRDLLPTVTRVKPDLMPIKQQKTNHRGKPFQVKYFLMAQKSKKKEKIPLSGTIRVRVAKARHTKTIYNYVGLTIIKHFKHFAG